MFEADAFGIELQWFLVSILGILWTLQGVTEFGLLVVGLTEPFFHDVCIL